MKKYETPCIWFKVIEVADILTVSGGSERSGISVGTDGDLKTSWNAGF